MAQVSIYELQRQIQERQAAEVARMQQQQYQQQPDMQQAQAQAPTPQQQQQQPSYEELSARYGYQPATLNTYQPPESASALQEAEDVIRGRVTPDLEERYAQRDKERKVRAFQQAMGGFQQAVGAFDQPDEFLRYLGPPSSIGENKPNENPGQIGLQELMTWISSGRGMI